jgi:hypothetical protein
MRAIVLIALLALSGCVTPAAILPTAARHGTDPAPPAAPPANGSVLLKLTRIHFDTPLASETEGHAAFVVPNGTAALRVHVAWSSATGAAATIPGGAEIVVKAPGGKRAAGSAIGPGPLPGPYDARVDAPAAGLWIIDLEGYAPGVSADLIVSAD